MVIVPSMLFRSEPDICLIGLLDSFGAITKYPSTIVFLKQHPLKNETYLFWCKLVDGYSVIFFYPTKERINSLFLEQKGCGTK